MPLPAMATLQDESRGGRLWILYDPDRAPASADWLATDEGERIELVSAYHRGERIKVPNAQLHAVIHVIVENQLALGEEVVVNALARLQTEALSRHDALHAIGSVLAADLYELMREGADTGDIYSRYLERLEKLTAAQWRADSQCRFAEGRITRVAGSQPCSVHNAVRNIPGTSWCARRVMLTLSIVFPALRRIRMSSSSSCCRPATPA